ncbi:MAG: thioredoxin-dependent thiol peroxidase [Epsilonproteobacteria bacterium]|jgi:peroxiredoxin Q/BCP|uniref:Putative peroxiredoxin bcp n=1 Tax=Sulfurospirillum cavolei TaxID=366522 RepID=A0A2D3WFJ2_9BACT|nr:MULTISPECIES: thioredoxin-dependent thiol peroxidase [unclassified Sulfurospirillum]MCD8545486.1 thioredoxin-dependent thiol peroxidase [Sulfurospirillum cavolei]NCB55496.1 thioredoxin-dependent thiol peroxidase [Campylobacterota bacterium]KHG34743.1 MAG: peroxiredoxin [Sulfurospirillum sp. MES]MCP3652336.1 thioredoxin-dependent thiol peroxidase [Sulfurospirillum sp. DNRA8]MCR1811186.1 thioredoxin-dependent thiol peroxidase [Sulfurospirillum sp. DNRA8]
MLKIGDNAPELTLPNQDDVEISLRDLAGKWIVLYFYPKDNTPGCTTEACDFTATLPQFDTLGAVVLGVSPDSTASHQKFIAKQKLDITLLSDSTTQIAQRYGVWQLKKFCGKEYMGIVRSTFLIDPEGKIAKIWSNVKVKDHASEVKKVLEALV